MNKEDKTLESESVEPESILNLEEFDLKPISSAEMIKPQISADGEAIEEEQIVEAKSEVAPEIVEVQEDPIFKELAEPKLPELPRENRARLQMQSPNRVYFYWSLKNNPFHILQKIFGRSTDNYRLVAKLINQKNETEEIHLVEAEGNRWYDVDADSTYRAEIGFYAPNRPFIRILFSNQVETPRKSPSQRRDYAPDFAVNAQKFAEILKSSGYRQDAFEVALAGDDVDYADYAAKNAFSRLTGKQFVLTDNAGELRFALLALASGYALEDLRRRINPSLFAVLSESAEKLTAEKTLSALQENFEVAEEFYEEAEERITPTVFGASLVNFPRSFRKRTAPRKILPKFEPVSSLKPF